MCNFINRYDIIEYDIIVYYLCLEWSLALAIKTFMKQKWWLLIKEV